MYDWMQSTKRVRLEPEWWFMIRASWRLLSLITAVWDKLMNLNMAKWWVENKVWVTAWINIEWCYKLEKQEKRRIKRKQNKISHSGPLLSRDNSSMGHRKSDNKSQNIAQKYSSYPLSRYRLTENNVLPDRLPLPSPGQATYAPFLEHLCEPELLLTPHLPGTW